MTISEMETKLKGDITFLDVYYKKKKKKRRLTVVGKDEKWDFAPCW